MIRRLCAALLLLLAVTAKSQCPRIYNYLGALTYSPQFINCNGNAYVVGFQSDVSFGSYTVSWGDSSPDHTAGTYVANSVINHTYSAATGSYVLTFTTGTCVLTGTVVNEQPALASIIVPGGVGSTLCAPKTLTFSNATTFTSTSTTYTWYFGDGTSEVHTYTNSGQNVTHLYQKGTVNCVTQVSLMAQNYCNFTPSSNSFGPLQVFDIDDAGVTPSQVVKCWPDNQFTFTNSTNRNCLPQGNTSQRYERWTFEDYKGPGQDSVIDWNPWPPSVPRAVSFPTTGVYAVTLADSNMCGIDIAQTSVLIVTAPVAGLLVPTLTICQNNPVTFTNTSTNAPQYRWNFGAGGGFQTLAGTTRTFTYTNPGTYTVRLVALIPGGGGACTDTAVGVIDVQPSPTSSFAVGPTSGCGSLTAMFTDQSTGAAAWNWVFGNANTSSLQAPPAQDFTVAGVHISTLTVTSASGCVRSSTAPVIVRNKPLPSFAGINACEGAPLNFTNTSAAGGTDPVTSYTWNFGDGSAVSTATNPSHTYTATGSYTVGLIAATAFCTDSITQPVTIFVKPTASFVMTPTVGCPPFTATLSNLSQNASSYHWDFGTSPTSTAATTGAMHTYTNITPGFLNHTVTLIAISPAGCADTISGPVQVRPKPVASFTSNTITGCSPLVTTFSSTSQGASTYSWSFGDGTTATTPNPVHTYSNSTLFTQTVVATLLVTNSVTCSDTVSQLITVYPEALTVFSMVPAMGCSPLLVNFPSVPGVATYSWNHGDGTPTFTTLTAHNYTYANTGLTDLTFTVTLTAQTSNGCVGSGTGTLMVFHNPVSDFTMSPLGGCNPLEVTFQNTSSGTIDTLAWTFGNGFTSNNQIVATTFTNGTGAPEKNYEARLRVRTNRGCEDSVTKSITVYAQPRAAFTPDTPACSPKLIRFTNHSAGAISYRWHFGDGATSTSDSAGHFYVNSTGFTQSYQAKLVATSVNMCADSIVIPVRIYPKPEFVVSALPESGCSPLSVFFPSVAGVASYEWKYDNNISFGSAGDIENTFENKTAVVKVFTVQLVARDVHTCSDTSYKEITVYPLPTARFSAKPLSVFIPDQPVVFTNESSSIATNFTWDFGDGEGSGEKNPVHYYTAAGEYKVVLVAHSVFGCSDTFALSENVMALEESTIQMPNAFTPNPTGSPGTVFDPRDTSNDIFHPNVKGAEKYTFSIYSRWGELLFETRSPAEGWDGYYKGKICTPDVYVWKVTATFIDGKTINQTGDVLLLR